MQAFTAVNPKLDTSAISRLSFIFDRSDKGAIIFDDISLGAAPAGVEH